MTTEQKDQINKLNTTIRSKLGVSKIHGIGVIALRDIKAGEQCYCAKTPQVYSLSYGNFGKLSSEVREQILSAWPTVVNGSRFLAPTTMMTSYMNHSEDPNYNPITDCAKKDIKEGEEITVNYKNMNNWEKVFSWLK